MIVVTRGVSPARAAASLGLTPSNVFRSALTGFAARLTQSQVRTLALQPWVTRILPDDAIAATDDPPADPPADPPPTTPLPTPGPDFQITPTGIERVGRPDLEDAPLDGSDQHIDVDIAILDVGVDTHPDLNVVGGHDCTGSKKGWLDNSYNGHGTHVAGIAAARDNDFGVVGVAPGARIWSVKVLNARGYGRQSWLLCGIDWVAGQRDPSDPSRALIEVANLSLRFRAVSTPSDDGDCGFTLKDLVHRAICRATDAGTIFVVAAGNDRRDAAHYRPATYSEVITVSGLADFDGQPGNLAKRSNVCPPGTSGDRDDSLMRVSNWGLKIDIMAPGKCIWSTGRHGAYRAMSGTSMATPHVAGAVALYRALLPTLTAAEIRTALAACATLDWKTGSDRDGIHESVLNVSQLCAPGAPDPPT